MLLIDNDSHFQYSLYYKSTNLNCQEGIKKYKLVGMGICVN